MPITIKEDCLTVKDLATHLKIAEKTVRRMESNGIIPGMRFGRCLRFDPIDVTEFKKSMKTLKRKKKK